MPKKSPQTKSKNVKNYKYVSHIYDFLNKKIDYNIWAIYLNEIFEDDFNKDSMILELGAGTSKLANAFQKKYKNYFPIDLSKEMLLRNELAKNKIVCSMIELPFKKKFDLVISAFDSVNYLLTKKDLIKLFQNVNNVLNDNGVFLFDVSLECNSYVHTSKPVRKGKTENFSFVQESSYNDKTKIHTNKFILTDKNGNRFQEIHREKIYPLFSLFPIIEKCGFYVEYCFDAFTFDNARENSERAQFVIKKNKNII